MAYLTHTATTMIAAVRDIVDLDANDLPDTLIKLYIRDGYYRILDVEKRWPFLEKSFTITTVASQRAYVISSMTADPITQVASIVDNTSVGYRLSMVSYDELEAAYVGALDTANNPLFYAVFEGKIHLFPKPNNVRTLTARGYREPVDWVTTGAAADLPAGLHFALVYYACSRIYQRLEDTVMADDYKRSFDEAVSFAVRNVQKPNSHSPMVLSAGRTGRQPTYSGWLTGLGRTL